MTGEYGGRHVWITGASSGIGLALARRMAGMGAKLSLSARRADLLERLAGECRAAGGEAFPLPLDVSDREAIYAAHAQAAAQSGPVDLLVANAGVSQGHQATADLAPEAIERIVTTNLTGALHTVRAVLPSMLERRTGHVVGISSLAGYRGLPRSTVYGATKSGFSNFLEGLRIEVRGTGVAVTDICPGFVKTPMTEDVPVPMPFLMDVERAVDLILRAIRRRRPQMGFPWQTNGLLRVAQCMPAWMYDRIIARFR